MGMVRTMLTIVEGVFCIVAVAAAAIEAIILLKKDPKECICDTCDHLVRKGRKGEARLVHLLTDASDALEELLRKEKFHAFIWKTLGHYNMMQLVEMYHEQEENDRGIVIP